MVALLETQQFQHIFPPIKKMMGFLAEMNLGGWIRTWADVGLIWATLQCSITLGWSIKNRDTSCCTHTLHMKIPPMSLFLEALPPCYIIDWKTDSQFLDEWLKRSYKDSDSGEVANLPLGTGNILMLRHGESCLQL